jgi:uncharacterized RDD family membrane protein YckC
MKTKNIHIPNQAADFVVQRDIFGQIKNMRTSVVKKIKYKSINAPELNVTYAGLGLRAIAAFVDLAIILAVILILNLIFLSSSQMNEGFNGYIILIGIFIWIIYNGMFQSSAFEATMGEMLLKLKVIDLYGKRMSFLRASFRCISVIFSILPVGLGIWYITTDPKKRSWHDLIAGSFVIKA